MLRRNSSEETRIIYSVALIKEDCIMKKKCSAFQKRWSCVVVSVVITTIGATRLSKIKQVSRFLLSTVSAKTFWMKRIFSIF